MAALLHYQPEVVAITQGYHGTHQVLEMYSRFRPDFKVIALDDDYTPYKNKKFVCWLETPVNPYGTCRDIEHCEWFGCRKREREGLVWPSAPFRCWASHKEWHSEDGVDRSPFFDILAARILTH